MKTFRVIKATGLYGATDLKGDNAPFSKIEDRVTTAISDGDCIAGEMVVLDEAGQKYQVVLSVKLAPCEGTKPERRVRIVQDTDGGNDPRDWSNLGVMACWHRSYKLGDVQPEEDPMDYQAGLPEGTIILPLFLIDHSGISMRTHDFSDCDPGHWDSGQVGIIYCTPEKLAEEYDCYLKDGSKTLEEIREIAKEVLQQEVRTYDKHLTGDVWGFVIEDLDECSACGRGEWVHVDSCWGFIGGDEGTLEDSGILDHVGDQVSKEALEKAWEDRS